jgi:hypothetical protein
VSESDDEEQGHGTRTDREAILARRRRFVVAALTGITTSTLATACPCLKIAPSEEPHEPQADGQPKDDGDPVEEASPEEGGVAEERSGAEGGGGEAEPGGGEAEGERPEAPSSAPRDSSQP